jgi:alanyl-tRNA synthetase
MLGNWSLGDYFKQEAIEWSFDFLTNDEWLGLPLDRLGFSVFAGDEDAPFDQESYDKWLSLGVAEPRIAKLGKKDNWWGPAGNTGPCGPDTEMFYWVGDLPAPESFDPENKKWVEIWNDVFMQYCKHEDGSFTPLEQVNVDTGMGLERVTAVLQGKSSCYDTELFAPLFAKLTEISGCENPRDIQSGRIVVEHIRSAVFMMADGVKPGNVEQPYVLRRLIRRSIREARKIGVEGHFTVDLANTVIDNFKEVYSELEREAGTIRSELEIEEETFAKALVKGERELVKMIEKVPDFVKKKVIGGKKAFDLYQTHGFPLELTQEIAGEHGFEVDLDGFEKARLKHIEASSKGAQKYAGGLVDHEEQTMRLHTATHLMHQALKDVLGDHVQQKGSNITADRLRFDFSHDEKVNKEQQAEVERIVNEQIQRGLDISVEEMPFEEAKDKGAIGYFADRYGEVVKVYSIGDFSMEICGGPHVKNTSEIGTFKIKKEEASSRGVRRIKATVTGQQS